jgi:hypothetical protein
MDSKSKIRKEHWVAIFYISKKRLGPSQSEFKTPRGSVYIRCEMHKGNLESAMDSAFPLAGESLMNAHYV